MKSSSADFKILYVYGRSDSPNRSPMLLTSLKASNPLLSVVLFLFVTLSNLEGRYQCFGGTQILIIRIEVTMEMEAT